MSAYSRVCYAELEFKMSQVRALTPSEEITPMGRLLSKLPTDVHLGKFILVATLFRCLDPALTIAATLNSKSPFISPLGFEREADLAKLSFRVGALVIQRISFLHITDCHSENSDFLTIHNAFSSWRRACANGVARKFCKDSYLSFQVSALRTRQAIKYLNLWQNLQQIEELRQQFLGQVV